MDETKDIVQVCQERMIDRETKEIFDKLSDTSITDTSIEDLTNLFNANQTKKSMLRVLKLNDLADKISDVISERINSVPTTYGNDELTGLLQKTISAIESSSKQINQVENFPVINLNKNDLNINVGADLTVESRRAVENAVKLLLEQSSKDKSTVIDLQEE